jgi:hypothetical protein
VYLELQRSAACKVSEWLQGAAPVCCLCSLATRDRGRGKAAYQHAGNRTAERSSGLCLRPSFLLIASCLLPMFRKSNSLSVFRVRIWCSSQKSTRLHLCAFHIHRVNPQSTFRAATFSSCQSSIVPIPRGQFDPKLFRRFITTSSSQQGQIRPRFVLRIPVTRLQLRFESTQHRAMAVDAFSDRDILPDTVKPINYAISIYDLELGGAFSYQGTVGMFQFGPAL